MKAIVLQPVKIKGKRVAPDSVITVNAEFGAELIAAGVVVEATPEALAALEQRQQPEADAGDASDDKGGAGDDKGNGGDAGGAGGDAGGAGGGAGGPDAGAAGQQGAAQ